MDIPLLIDTLADVRTKAQEILDLTDRLNLSAVAEPEVSLSDKIGDLLGIGSMARSDSTILTCIRNMKHFSEHLHAIEREFFMVPGEVDDDYPDDPPEPECLLNCWGSTTPQYVEEFRAALATIRTPTPSNGKECEALSVLDEAFEKLVDRGVHMFDLQHARATLAARLEAAERLATAAEAFHHAVRYVTGWEASGNALTEALTIYRSTK